MTQEIALFIIGTGTLFGTYLSASWLLRLRSRSRVRSVEKKYIGDRP